MTVPNSLPAPRKNLSSAGMATRFDDITSTDVLVAAGDFTGGASEDLFTLSSHGLLTGDVVAVIGQSAQGVVSSGAGTRAIVSVLSSSTFQLTTNGTTIIENTADGTAYLLKCGHAIKQATIDAIVSRVIVGGNDTTGGTVEDMNSGRLPNGVIDGTLIKLLYKSAAGAAAVAADATAYVKSPVTTTSATAVSSYFQTSATAGGAVLDTTADGTNLWLIVS